MGILELELNIYDTAIEQVQVQVNECGVSIVVLFGMDSIYTGRRRNSNLKLELVFVAFDVLFDVLLS